MAVRPHVVVLRALGVGDLLTAVPALRGIRRALPGHELVLAAPGRLAPLVDLIGCVDRLLATEELAPIGWADPPPDVAVDLHGCGPESHRLLSRLRPERLVAFECLAALTTGPVFDPDEHEVRRWARLVEQSFGVPVDPSDLGLRSPGPPGLGEGAVVLHVGAAAGSRRWPAGRFAEVALWCRERGLRVLVTGGAEDVPAAARVARRAELPAGADLTGRTGLGELAAVVAGARLVVSGDTGAAHLASAYRRPSVVLFGPESPSRWGPPEDGPHVVIAHGAGGGDPHASALDPALSRITVEEVLAAARGLLGEPVGSGSASARTAR